jgi:putative methyltransferase (TIGR04325 family)
MMKIKDFIQPVLNRSLTKLVSSKNLTAPPLFFQTYSKAQEACSSSGYEDVHLVEAVFEKTGLIKGQMLNGKFPLSDSTTQSLLAVLLSLQFGEKQNELKVIDFGGACGAHYFQIRPFLPSNAKIDWIIVETPRMAEKAMAFETDELHFVTSLLEAKEKLRSVDLLHSSGTLQYTPDPKTTVREFIMCHPNYIFLNRLALSATDAFITIQESLLSANGPGPLPHLMGDKLCCYPITYFPKHQLEKILTQNYRIRFNFADTKTFVGKKETHINTALFAERNP